MKLEVTLPWRATFDMMSAATRVHPSISKTTEKIMPARLFDSAPPRASEPTAAPSAVSAHPASEHIGQCSRAIIPGDDPGDQQPPNSISLFHSNSLPV
jgi:hypothetical protein